jgi:hypothetical protein
MTTSVSTVIRTVQCRKYENALSSLTKTNVTIALLISIVVDVEKSQPDLERTCSGKEASMDNVSIEILQP